MAQDNSSGFQNRREFFRVKFATPLRFRAYTPGRQNRQSPPVEARSQNVSQSGILFQTETPPPQLSSILWMDMDLRTLKICQEIEERALVTNNGILGRVVRVEEDAKNRSAYDVGVCFITQDQKNSREVQDILAELSTQAAAK